MKEYYSLSGFGREAFSLWCGPCENCFFVNWETKNLIGGGEISWERRLTTLPQPHPRPTAAIRIVSRSPSPLETQSSFTKWTLKCLNKSLILYLDKNEMKL